MGINRLSAKSERPRKEDHLKNNYGAEYFRHQFEELAINLHERRKRDYGRVDSHTIWRREQDAFPGLIRSLLSPDTKSNQLLLRQFNAFTQKQRQEFTVYKEGYKSLIPSLSPNSLFEETVHKLRTFQEAADVQTVKETLDFASRSEREKVMAWRETLQRYLLTHSGGELALKDFSHSIADMVDHDPALFSLAIETIRQCTVSSLNNYFDELPNDERNQISQRRLTFISDVQKATGSYLLQLFARGEAHVVQEGRLSHETINDPKEGSLGSYTPFLITNDRYAILSNFESRNVIVVASEEDTSTISHLLSQQADKEVRSFFYERDTLAPRKDRTLPIDALYLPGNAGNEDEKRSEYERQRIFFSPYIRQLISDDIGVSLPTLSLREQFYFLRFLRDAKTADAESIKQFAHAFGESGLKTFLVSADDITLIVLGRDIQSTDKETLLRIQAERYKDKYPETLEVELRNGLANALKNQYSQFYIYRKDGEIVSYLRFDGLAASNDTSAHMASVMTNPHFEGGALGQALLETALKREVMSGRAVYAECDPGLVPFYEKFGFRLLRSYKDDYGVDTCDIVLESESESLREAA